VNGGNGANAVLQIGNNLTLQGGGTLNLSTIAASGGSAYLQQATGGLTLTNVNNIIQGEGIIGSNGLTLVNQNIINANSTGGLLSPYLYLQGLSLTNPGLVEATNNAILAINGVVVNNAGGNITANGTNTMVQLYASTDIQGGTLTNNGGWLGTVAGYTATLDGTTNGALNLHGTYTADHGSVTHLLGTINNNNVIQVNGGNGADAVIEIDNNLTLQGGGTLNLSTITASGGSAYLEQASGGLILTNVNNIIQGEGIIGNNGLTLVNQNIIDANSTGAPLSLSLNLQGLALTNPRLVEATNQGVLNINGVVVNNAGGNITANGSGTFVQLFGSTQIQGGTLTNNGGWLGTPVAGTAYLEGNTVAGPVTINGTYTSDLNATTDLLGTINNQGNLLVNGGSGANGTLVIDTANVTLTGGGTVTLSTAGGGGNAVIYQVAGGYVLENFNNTIQGAAIIGNNGLSLLNDIGGTVLANAPGQTLLFQTAGTVTNNGTFQADAGSTLWLQSVTSFTNFSGNTLTGGTYNVYGTTSSPGTLQINALGNTGGEIVNNAATIYLNGPNSNFVDSASLDALSNFSNNTATGSFTITNGRNFTSPSSIDFANAGAVTVGSASTFTTGGTRNYNQSGGSTQLIGTLIAGGGSANFSGGVLYGNGGTVNGNVTMAGTIAPAATINGSNVPQTAGQLNINGNYTQTSAGVFNLGLGGLTAGTQFGYLNVSGNALINGTLNVNLLSTYFPVVGDTFKFLTTGGLVSGTFTITNGLNIGRGEILSVFYGSNFVELTTGYIATTDLWNGGTGNWSNGPQWSIGVPAPAFDVIIYSGGNDLVTMDVGSSTVKSLAVGGASNGFTSVLTDGSTAQNLTITNGLTVGQQGTLSFTGTGSTITAGTVSNNGSVTIGHGATLNLTGQPLGVTSVGAGASWTIGGNFEVGGVANTGFANLSSVSGSVTFADGASQTIGNSLTNNAGGFVDVDAGSTLTITGNVTNNAFGPQGIYTGFYGAGSNAIHIAGNLTNNGKFGLESAGDIATVGGNVTNNSGALFAQTAGSSATFTGTLLNGGQVDLENASSLNVTGATTNNGTLSTTGFTGTGGNTMTFSGLLTNNATGQINVNGPSDTLHASGGLVNAGSISVTHGSTIDPPFFNNLGTLTIDGTSTFVVGGAATGPGFIQLSTGTFGEMINSATAFGVVHVAGSASLNGTLDILLQSGYNPAVGTSFTFLLLNPGQLTGTYATILNDIFNGGTEKWVVNYNDARGSVSLTAASIPTTTPEPGTFLLLGSGLLTLSYGVRRRWQK
jgi:hypothetical protein